MCPAPSTGHSPPPGWAPLQQHPDPPAAETALPLDDETVRSLVSSAWPARLTQSCSGAPDSILEISRPDSASPAHAPSY